MFDYQYLKRSNSFVFGSHDLLDVPGPYWLSISRKDLPDLPPDMEPESRETGWVICAGHRRNRRVVAARRDGYGDPISMSGANGSDTLRGWPDFDQQRRTRKPELTSDQGNHFPLSISIAFDVPSRSTQIPMAGKLLDIAQAPADFADFSSGASDERPATAVA